MGLGRTEIQKRLAFVNALSSPERFMRHLPRPRTWRRRGRVATETRLSDFDGFLDSIQTYSGPKNGWFQNSSKEVLSSGATSQAVCHALIWPYQSMRLPGAQWTETQVKNSLLVRFLEIVCLKRRYMHGKRIKRPFIGSRMMMNHRILYPIFRQTHALAFSLNLSNFPCVC